MRGINKRVRSTILPGRLLLLAHIAAGGARRRGTTVARRGVHEGLALLGLGGAVGARDAAAGALRDGGGLGFCLLGDLGGLGGFLEAGLLAALAAAHEADAEHRKDDGHGEDDGNDDAADVELGVLEHARGVALAVGAANEALAADLARGRGRGAGPVLLPGVVGRALGDGHGGLGEAGRRRGRVAAGRGGGRLPGGEGGDEVEGRVAGDVEGRRGESIAVTAGATEVGGRVALLHGRQGLDGRLVFGAAGLLEALFDGLGERGRVDGGELLEAVLEGVAAGAAFCEGGELFALARETF